MWGSRADKRPELVRLAAKANAIFLALPPESQRKLHETIEAIAAAADGLKVLPDAMGSVLFDIVLCVFRQRAMPVAKPKVRAQLEQLIAGAPELLGPYEKHVDTLAAEVAA